MGKFEDNKQYTFDVDSAPTSWLDYSEELKEIAELIFTNSGTEINRYPENEKGLRLERGYFLNYGFSIENILKGLLISENNAYVSDGKISPEISSNHNLVILIDKIDSISFDKNERKLLTILSDAIPYWGRYPIPKKHTKVLTKFKLTEKVNKDLNDLWFKIGRKLYSNIKFGWIGPNGIETGPYISSTFENSEEFDKSLAELNKQVKKGNFKAGNVDITKYSRKK
ncbi:hypothetical protein H0I31_09015 [Tenacibaculum sp. AHE15PA]|uniref:hypothetical protein n=1 Tax=unclassified Tenacibaculum TaxID=2635139 RepID=UPI001C4FA6BA|nr:MULTISPECIES: hypothetical protein [unclassified Tenacibaculum]QXP74311.1 hypothetical protein H0I30_03955 [Tenacibaculum sp. AHE14PA]QXP75319.1 hypothetical protein H0I31_09015 [Tenacibaculum sp. AHE15PA]